MTEFFKSAQPLFAGDLETNRLLKEQIRINSIYDKPRRTSNPLLRVIFILFFGPIYKLVEKKPRFRRKANKFARKYLPVWLKRFIKIQISVLPKKIEEIHGIYELIPMDLRTLERSFGLPSANNPEVSIIIPVHNHIETTLDLLNTFRFNTDLVKFEIIIVDDASTDATPNILEKIRGINVLTQVNNVGYLLATNSAIKYCKGKYICLLNNDTIPESGWLDALVRTLKMNPDVAIAGSMLVSSDGMVAEAGSQIFRNREIWNLGRWAERGSALFNFTREVDYCSAAAILVDGEFLRSINGFDERYAPAYFEDTDIAMQAWKQGRKVVYVHDSVVHHIEGLSHGKNTSTGLKAFQVINENKFWQKWEKSIELPWILDEVPRYEAQRDSRGIIVYADNFIPSSDSNAGAVRGFRIIEAMQLLKFHVIVLPQNPGIAIINREKLQRAGVEVYQSYDEALENIKLRKDRVSSFWVARVDVAEQLLPRIKIDFPEKPVYFDTVDLHHLRDQRNIALNGADAAIYGEEIEEIEMAICKISDKVIVVADYENQYLLQKNPELEVHTLFMPYEATSNLPKIRKKNSILFVGSFMHTPNLDAIDWLIDEILPKINNISDEQIHLEIVGEFLPISVQEKIDGDKIKYHGWLESLDSVYAETSLVVVPLRYGAGKKGKINEAVVHGCPIVSTSIGVEGFPLLSGEDFILADSAEEFAAAILKLLSDQQLSLKYAESAFSKIAKDSSFKSFVGKVASILDVNYPN